jgi:hypothetical protein
MPQAESQRGQIYPQPTRSAHRYSSAFHAATSRQQSASPHSDHASQEVVRGIIPPIPLPRSLAPSITTPLYYATVSQALRQPLRGRAVANFGGRTSEVRAYSVREATPRLRGTGRAFAEPKGRRGDLGAYSRASGPTANRHPQRVQHEEPRLAKGVRGFEELRPSDRSLAVKGTLGRADLTGPFGHRSAEQGQRTVLVSAWLAPPTDRGV